MGRWSTDFSDVPNNRDVWIWGGEWSNEDDWGESWGKNTEVERVSKSQYDDYWFGGYHDEYGSRTAFRNPTHWMLCETPKPPQ